MQGLTREQWAEKLALIGAYIKARGAELTIEVIGSWPAIELGMPGRTSEDLDVWMPNSRFDSVLFRDACLEQFNKFCSHRYVAARAVAPGFELGQYVSIQALRSKPGRTALGAARSVATEFFKML